MDKKNDKSQPNNVPSGIDENELDLPEPAMKHRGALQIVFLFFCKKKSAKHLSRLLGFDFNLTDGKNWRGR